MKYIYSEHYREDPYDEVDAARLRNSPESVMATFEARLESEAKQIPLDTEAIERIQNQLTYLGSVATAESVMVA